MTNYGPYPLASQHGGVPPGGRIEPSRPRSGLRRFMRGRRWLLSRGPACPLLLALLAAAEPAPAQAPVIKVTLLGTGSPQPVLERFGQSTLVEAGDQKLLFDVGRGALMRLNQTEVPLGAVRKVFLTHLHDDHTVGLPDFWLTGWLLGRPTARFEIWGPAGTREMMRHLEKAFAFDIGIRHSDDQVPLEGIKVVARDITPGVVYSANGVQVTAFEVNHDPVRPAFGYRLDYQGRSVVITGDSRPEGASVTNIPRYGAGADLLVYNVGSATRIRTRFASDSAWADRIIAHFTTPEQAAGLLARMNPAPTLTVYSHNAPRTTEEEVVAPTLREYHGRVVLGRDLMEIDIGPGVTVSCTRVAGGCPLAAQP